MPTSASPTPAVAPDTPLEVRGYVTDAKRVGYQVLTNYESIYWRALVGNDAWSLYEVLRSFCHNGNNTCTPSIQFLTTILGLEDKRALIGRSKTVKGKEYRYAGLIEALQEHKLVVAEVQGEAPKTSYLFHVNLTPDLLTPAQLAQLPTMLQKKHAELLKRSAQAQRELDAKRKPSRFENGNKNSSGNQPEGGGNFPRGVGISHGGGGNFPPEQYPYNNTHITTPSTREDHNNNKDDSPDKKAAAVVVVALSADQQAVILILTQQGIAEKVAKRLVQRYSHARIAEKITYLEFLLADQPAKVQNPRGWLRRAIEEDYGPPDGFVTAEERARRAAEAAAQAARDAALEQQQQALAAQIQTQEKEQKRHWQARYGATAADEQVWQEVCAEFRYSHPHLYQLFMRAYLLNCTQETIQLGFAAPIWLHQAQHPSTLAALARTLKIVVGRPLTVDLILLPVAESSPIAEEAAPGP